jgi:hypothetical protein
MTTPQYMDLENGVDANDGSSFANRYQTFATGATAARTAPGDTIRVMASPDPTLVDSAAQWNQDSKIVTLQAAITQMIADCEAAWTASANVTATTSTAWFKEGTKSANLAIASGFTTGLAAYFATGTLDLSGYQQVSFWIQTSIAVAASTLSLRLCSDTAGVTTVDTIAIPALTGTSTLSNKITVDLGAALGSSIKSVALYCDLDPGTVTVRLDNIMACKASSSADALTLQSLIGKVHNLSWVASTSYTLGDKRRPTQPNRNGYQYKKQNSGTQSSGGSEPTWPTEIGKTVADGSITWVCEELEDTWYPIQSINGVTVKIDNDAAVLGSAGQGYSGATESVPTYKRECINVSSLTTTSAAWQTTQESGSDGSHIAYSGGWNRTDMSTQTGETWVQSINGRGTMFVNARNYMTFINLNVGWAGSLSGGGAAIRNTGRSVTINNCHGPSFDQDGNQLRMVGADWHNDTPGGGKAGLNMSTSTFDPIIDRVSCNNHIGNGLTGGWPLLGRHVYAARNSTGIQVSNADGRLHYCVTRGNTQGIDAVVQLGWAGGLRMFKCLFPDGLAGFNQPGVSGYIYSQDDQQVAGVHKIYTDDGTIVSDASTRDSATGIAWDFKPTSTRNSEYPMRLSVGRFPVKANVTYTFSIRTRRDATTVTGQLFLAGGQIAGVPADVSVNSTPSINTWTTSGTVSFTPTEDGVVELEFRVWSTASSVNYWVDNLAKSPA